MIRWRKATNTKNLSDKAICVVKVETIETAESQTPCYLIATYFSGIGFFLSAGVGRCNTTLMQSINNITEYCVIEEGTKLNE